MGISKQEALELFESDDLPEHWARLDEFEGSGYQRVVTRVNTEEGERSAWIYVLAGFLHEKGIT